MKISILRIKYKCISSANNNPLSSKNKLLIKIIIILKKLCINPLYYISNPK